MRTRLRALEPVQLAEGVHGPRCRRAQVPGSRNRRGEQHRPDPGDRRLDDRVAAAASPAGTTAARASAPCSASTSTAASASASTSAAAPGSAAARAPTSSSPATGAAVTAAAGFTSACTGAMPRPERQGQDAAAGTTATGREGLQARRSDPNLFGDRRTWTRRRAEREAGAGATAQLQSRRPPQPWRAGGHPQGRPLRWVRSLVLPVRKSYGREEIASWSSPIAGRGKAGVLVEEEAT
jgi:hypothetical protein